MFPLMRRALPCLVAAGAAAVAGCAHRATSEPVLDDAPASPSRATRYDVVIELDAEAGVAHFTGTLGPLPDRTELDGDALELRFARRFAFVTLPPRFAEPLTAMADGKLLDFPEKLDEFRFRVEPAGHEQIELRWSIPLDYREDPEVIAGTDGYEHSYLAKGHGMLFTGELIPMPQVEVAVATLQVIGDHTGKVMTPWPAARGTEGTTFEPSITELADDIVLVGQDWRTIETQAQGLNFTFALAPGSVWMEPLVEELLMPIAAPSLPKRWMPCAM